MMAFIVSPSAVGALFEQEQGVSRGGIRPICRFRFDWNDRDQWQTGITYCSQQAMQCGLIEHRAG
jgi:hypothetical protein